MQELVIFYSFGGSTRKIARELADARGADLVEVRDEKKLGLLGAFMRVPSARGMKKTPVLPMGVDLNAYEKISVLAPVWGDFPAPAINNVFDALPEGKAVEVRLVSSSGKSRCEAKVREKVEERGCSLELFENLRYGEQRAAVASAE